jgi:hypothetical protein
MTPQSLKNPPHSDSTNRPSITVTRRLIRPANSIECVTTTIATRSSPANSNNNSVTRTAAARSNAPVGSSANNNRGRSNIARTTAAR